LALTASDVARVGEGIALRDLLLKGFTIQKWNTPEELPASSDIEAIEPVTKKLVLIRVKSAVEPNIPESLSSDLEGELKLRATKAGAEAWEAKVQLDTSLKQGKVSWRQLG
jgi:hypothetical protein